MIDKINFTIAIPTYNGAKYLPELLERLKNQIDTESFSWEIIVIDNNSTDKTAEIVKKYQSDWKENFPLKYFLETRQGAAYARECAIKEAKADLIGFLDDDNYPVSNWVSKAYTFSQKYPHAGAYASQIHPDWEVYPPENLQRLIPFFAITERGNLPLLYEPQKKLLPPSAGLVIRRQAWLESIPEKSILTGRANGNMLTGEDLEILSYIQNSAWEIWYNPEMELYHQIPAWRLREEYLLPFFRGIGLSRYVTRMANYDNWVKPIILILYILNDIRKIIFHVVKYRLKIKNDLAAACEMNLFIGSLESPFYLWKNGYLSKD
ncbi:MAG: hormogonium polysaccharide biosynthesis glycosyltransferase HpsE [Cyanobacteria bacterium P01_A01_bin.45]